MSEVVHEGTHVLDNLEIQKMIESGSSNDEIYDIFGSSWSFEKRAYTYEKAFQRSAFDSVEYETIIDLLDQVKNYDYEH